MEGGDGDAGTDEDEMRRKEDQVVWKKPLHGACASANCRYCVPKEQIEG
jgi:hypothetical protein